MLFVFSFFASIFLVVFSVPAISRLAYKRQLFDESQERRKIHQAHIPHFGGVGIYLGILIPAILTSSWRLESWSLLLASLLVFTTGLVDDFKPVSPAWKFFFQFAAAFVLVVMGDVRVLSLPHIFNYDAIPYLPGVVITVWFIVGLINAFNLIDGIDGLAASLALFLFLVYIILFFNAGSFGLCLLCCSAAGSLAGFLFFNLSSRKKIFMGDCGSLFIGLLAAYATVKILDIGEGRLLLFSTHITAKIGFVVALLGVPMFDTLRVLVLRMLLGRSPFQADDNHIHHRLLCLGLSHLQATAILCGVNLMLAILALVLQQLGDPIIILLLSVVLLFLNSLLTILIRRSKAIDLQLR